MFSKLKSKLANTSKEAVKEEVKNHVPELLTGTAVVLLLYLCVKVNSKPINVTINIGKEVLH